MGTSDTSGQPHNSTPDHAKLHGDYLKILRQSLAKSAEKPYRKLAISKLLGKHPELDLSCVTGEKGLQRSVSVPFLQRLGLALTGYGDHTLRGCLTWLGQAEARWLRDHPPEEWRMLPASWVEKGLAGVLVSKKEQLPDTFIKAMEEAELPLLATSHSISHILAQMPSIMDRHLSPKICFHGNFLVISGFGVLILGRSGIGKSDDALDLIMHGHQLVADDVVHVYRNPLGKLIGTSDELTKHHLTIRGLGIINIKELFGVTAILESHPIDLVLFLEPRELAQQVLPQKMEELEILGVKMPLMRLPVIMGRNLLNLITLAVKTHELRTLGYDAEERLHERLRQKLSNEQNQAPES